MKQNIVVHRPADLSKGWAQRIVNQHTADAKVADICIKSVSIGTSTRLRVAVNHDAPEILPNHWFVKTPSLALKSRMITALPGLLHKEVQFYTSLSKATPVKVPQVLAAQTRFGLGSTLVMTDLTKSGFTAGQPGDALSIQQARLVIEQLARFHAHYWEHKHLLLTHRWLSGFNNRIEQYMGNLLAVPLMKKGLALADGLIPSELYKPALSYAANRPRITQHLATGPQTLVHHDCHPGNLFWQDSMPGFLDWQLVRMGEGISDVAYFLATALKPDCRRNHESELLSLYQENLANFGAVQLDNQYVYNRYRVHLAYAFEAMIITLAIGGMMERSSNIELISRTSAAVSDHNSLVLSQPKMHG